MLRLALPWVLLACASACGSSSGASSSGGSSSVSECPDVTVPSTLKVTVTGFVTCTCFNGSFTLTESTPGLWSSPAIRGCPGQTTTAYLKFTNAPATGDGLDGVTPGFDAGTTYGDLGFGIADAISTPGGGNSDLAVATGYTCSPFSVHGGGSKAGNTTAFCPSSEDERMAWVITTP
jgi:hypothetical protein